MAVPITLIGGGGHATVVAEAALAAGFAIRGVYDDNPECLACHALIDRTRTLPHLGKLRDLADPDWICCLGDLAARRTTLAGMSTEPARAIVHPSAVVSPTTSLGLGVFVGPLALVHTGASVAEHAIINSGAVVEHHCLVGKNAHIAPNATLGGEVVIGPDTLIGLGAVVLPGVRVGAQCVIGAGAVVPTDVRDGAQVKGVPAKPEL